MGQFFKMEIGDAWETKQICDFLQFFEKIVAVEYDIKCFERS
jgi:hypothetical protein